MHRVSGVVVRISTCAQYLSSRSLREQTEFHVGELSKTRIHNRELETRFGLTMNDQPASRNDMLGTLEAVMAMYGTPHSSELFVMSLSVIQISSEAAAVC